MPRKGSSPRTLDLFESTLTIPTPQSGPASITPKPPALASLSHAQLAEQLGQLLEEVQRRLEKGRGQHPKLEAAVKQALEALQRLVPSPTRQGRPSRSTRPSGFQVLARRWAVEVVFTQLTKADVLTLRAGGQHVPDFDLVVRDDNSVNQQQHELSALLEGGIRQPVLHPLTKGLQ